MSGILKFLWAEIITMSHDHGQNPNFLKSIHQFDHEHRENFGMSLAMVNALNYPPSPDLLLQTEKKKNFQLLYNYDIKSYFLLIDIKKLGFS